jgi:Tol biopolymer transport system component
MRVISPEGEWKPIVATQFQEEFPVFSPDGRWLAYSAIEADRYQVYVRPFPGPGTVTQISTDSGGAPVWSNRWRHLDKRHFGALKRGRGPFSEIRT